MFRLLLILVLIPSFLSAQKILTGNIIDSKTKQPIANATVYINETTYGTSSNSQGEFTISLSDFPCKLVFSHVSYRTELLLIQSNHETIPTIEMKQKILQMAEVKVEARNLRPRNLVEFKRYFLGENQWAENAEIVNEYALVFSRDRERKPIKVNGYIKGNLKVFVSTSGSSSEKIEWLEDSTYMFINAAINLKAHSREALMVDLPMLGYTVRVELLDFLLQYKTEYGGSQCSFLGLYYFIPKNPKNQREQRRFERNRQKVYFNSSQHFCRSLFQNKLKQNGYQLFEEIFDSLTYQKTYKEFQIEQYLNRSNDSEIQISGLNNKQFYLFYYPNSKGEPRDLTTQKAREPIQSQIYFQSDTCIIKANGVIPNRNIMFGGAISQKKIASMLPANYELPLTKDIP